MLASWRANSFLCALGLAALLLAWSETVSHMVQILWKVDAFAHGLLAPVVSASLVWARRKELSHLSPVGSWFGLLLVAGASIVWLSGSLLEIALFQHFALVTAVQGIVIGTLGISVYRQLLFPMLFLYFSVPFGSELVTPLQHLTASLVITSLDVIGASYTAQGMLITLPSGLYEVAEACAGVKFLFTSIFTGVLLAHLLYSGWKKRIAVVAASIVLPILANALRVLLIFLIAELSDQKLAKGFDHLVYGWVFLSVVLFTLISIAYRYADKPLMPETGKPDTERAAELAPLNRQIAIGVIVAFVPLLSAKLVPQSHHQAMLRTPSIIQPFSINNSDSFRTLANTDLVARPMFLSADEQWSSLFRHSGVVFRFHIARFDNLGSGQRLFQPGNSIAPEEWKPIESKRLSVVTAPCGFELVETVMRRGESETLVWAHYSIANAPVFNSVEEKLGTAWLRLQREPAEGLVIVFSAPLSGNKDQVRASFEEFLSTIAQDHDLNGVGVVNVGNGGLCAG